MTPLMCMAVAVFFEARNQSFDGMIAVAQTIENRVESSEFPNDICDVVFQKKQFSFTHDGKSDNPERYTTNETAKNAWEDSQEAAQTVMMLDHKFHNATYYHADYVKPKWSKVFQLVVVIDDHIFYRP